ncbi:MAG: tetratricopeptide repeat protein [Planctomycetota bacterium]
MMSASLTNLTGPFRAHAQSVETSTSTAQLASQEPVVARVEMRLADGDKLIDIIEQGDLLTVIEDRGDDYVIQTHDGTRGAVAKVNAVKLAESTDVYGELIARNPKEGRYHTLRASAWWALGKTQRALEDFDLAIEKGYTAAHAYTSRGLFHASMRQYDEAIADYSRAMEIEPDAIAPLINRAAAHVSAGRFDEAIQDYTDAIKLKPDTISLLQQRAVAHKAAGKLDLAADDFTKILKMEPNRFSAVMGRGYVRFQQQNHEAAVQDFGRAIELNPLDAVAHNNRGYNLMQLGREKEAADDYRKAIELAPKYGLALQNLAWLLATAKDQELRDADQAVATAKTACEISNYAAVGDLSALAASLAAQGKFDEAAGWQEKVVEAVSDAFKPFARKNLQRYLNEKPFAADPDAAEKQERIAAEKAKK